MTEQFHKMFSLQRLADTSGSPMVANLASVRGLVAHFGLMLISTTALMLVNLLTNPEAQWARAVLIVWLLVLVAHGIGIVIARLLVEDSHLRLRPAAQTSPSGGIGWTAPDGASATMDDPAGSADPWENVTAPDDGTDTSWPSVVTTEPEPVDDAYAEPDRADDNGERVPWRAATEIAWLRKWQSQKEQEEPQRRDSAS